MQKYFLSFVLGILYLGASIAVFLPSIIDSHRDSFQEEIKIRSEGLQILQLTSDEFKKINWIEKDHEFNWFGKLYDVKRINSTSKGFEVECINDEEEENLISFFETWKKNFPSNNSKVRLDPPFLYFYFSNDGTDVFSKPGHLLVQPLYFLEVADLIPHPPEIG